MDQVVEKLLQRPTLQAAQMAGAAVRRLMAQDPRRALSTLAGWSEHAHAFVRIASGVGFGILGARDREALPDVLPYVERLCNDNDAEVREHGASAALERLWLVHADAVANVVEEWAAAKNDSVREVVVRTAARIATSGQISRPTVLKAFIEHRLSLFDRLAKDASARIRPVLAEAVDEMGCLAPDLVSPLLAHWAESDDANVLRLVAEIGQLPFAGVCEGVDLAGAATRLKRKALELRVRAARWLRAGAGSVEYSPLFASGFLAPEPDAARPWTHVADAYRGCQLRCEFCHSRSSAEWLGETKETFVRRISVVRNAPEVLARELAAEAMSPRGEHVLCVGADSDPYQPAEERYELTREILKVCLDAGHPVVVQTRQALVERDADVLGALAQSGLVNVLVAMQTSVDGIRNRVEVGTSPVEERLRAMRTLADRGVPVGLVLAPIMPDLTDDPDLIEETIRAAAQAGAKWVVAQVLDLRASAGVKVRVFLEALAPDLIARYSDVYQRDERGVHVAPDYVRRVAGEMVPALAARHGAADVSRMLTSGRDATALLVRC
jgi:DNA repair photolyase/3-methyladenine DNA glycosylase AlkC